MKITPRIREYERYLEQLFVRLEQIEPRKARDGDEDGFIYAALVRYACIGLTGYLEVSLDSLLIGYASIPHSPLTKNKTESYLATVYSANYDKILEVLGEFNWQWRHDFARQITEASRRKEPDLESRINTVFKLRNQVAHGNHSINLTHRNLIEYHRDIFDVVRILARIID